MKGFMKKAFLAGLTAFCLLLPAMAQDNAESKKAIWDHGDNVSNISYHNVQIFRILDQADAYVIVYQKQGLHVGQVSIPKKWFKETPQKLQFRNKPKQLDPYMSVIYKDGQFYKVILTVPSSRSDAVWGVVPSGTKISGTDADTLEISY